MTGEPTKGALPDEVSQVELSRLLGITTRQLAILITDGVLPKIARGRYPLHESVQAYIRFKEKRADRSPQSSSADLLRQERAQEISLKIARQQRDIIPLVDALQAVDEITGLYVESLSGLPARITRIPRERQRLDTIFDEERLRLSDRLAKSRTALRTGVDDPEAEAEDDAG